MTERIIVLGAGDHAKVVVAALRRAGHEIAGVVDHEEPAGGAAIFGVPFLGDDSVLRAHPDILLANGIGGRNLRRDVFMRLVAAGHRFATVVDPASVIVTGAVLGHGAQVFAGSVVQCDAVVGDNAIINTRAIVEHDCRVGAHAHVATGAVLAGAVSVGEGTLIGTGAAVRKYIRIGSSALVGAGAVVVKDVPDGVTVMGVPARERKQ
jgi:UDP-perosamine 4-acetyltransferase